MPILREHRKRPRGPFPGRVQITLPSAGLLDTSPVNFSEGGLCLRLKETLEISAQVRLRLFAQAKRQPLTCDGRVAWVVQRLDLRPAPPFVYDVGVEFVKPPSRLKQWTTDVSEPPVAMGRANGRARLEPAVIAQRRYVPSLQRELSSREPWHLIVRVDGSPCFAKRFASQHEAVGAWGAWQRQLMRREAR